VGDPLDVSEPERQQGLRPLERLDLALFIDAEHHRVIGRMQIEPGNIK
jgi:hypothetical protein